MENKDWTSDLNPSAVDREAIFNVRPTIPLPQVGGSITIQFLSDPVRIAKEHTKLTRDFFIAAASDGTGIEKQIICSKCIRQHLAAAIANGKIIQIPGTSVTITAHILNKYHTTDGKIIGHAKVYDVAIITLEGAHYTATIPYYTTPI